MEGNRTIVTYKREKSIWLLISGLLLVGMGIFVIWNPETALIASALILGIIFILIGASYFLTFSKRRSYIYPVIGILDIFIGLILLFDLGATAISIPFIFGFWCMFNGIAYLIEGMQLKDNRLPFSGMAMTVGLLGILFGILVFLHPILGMLTITFLLGAYLIIYGMCELGRYFSIK